MLLLPDSSLLNDGLLNREDSLAQFKERQDEKNDRYRLPDQDMLTDVAASLGSPLSYTDFIKKVERLSKKRIWTENSINWPGGMNWYTIQGNEKVCLNAPFLKGYLPEFDVVHVDEHNLPNGRTPGWRNVLSRLIAAKVLIKSQVDRAFGIPLPNERSTRWHMFTRQFN